MDDFATKYARAVRYGAGYTHADFVRRINDDRRDRTAPLVYADWLDENGHPGTAEVVRASVGRSVEKEPESFWHAAVGFSPSEASPYHVPDDHPEGVPSAYVSSPWTTASGVRLVGVGTLHRLDGVRDFAGRSANLYFGVPVPIEEARRLLTQMHADGVRNAGLALKHLV